MQKLLTVGIPTFNGAAHIDETLSSIIRQISADIEDKIEILVSDNASTDGTGVLIEKYRESHPNLVRSRTNATNIGFDRNVDALFKSANGQYVWLIGDDDALYEGALIYVIDLLEKHKDLAAVQVNFDKFDKTLKNVVETISIPDDVYCQDGDAFLPHAKGRWGAIASLIIRTNDWNRLDLTDAFGSQIVFAHGLFKILRQGPAFVAKRSIVKVREGSEKAVTRGDGDARINIALASGALYQALLTMGYRKDILRPIIKADRRYAFEALPLAKFWGIKDKSAIAKKYISIHNSPVLWIKWLPLLFLPDSIYRVVYRLKKAVSSMTRPLEKKLKGFLRK